MKLTSIILLSACLSAEARGTAQTIKLDVKDAPLERVFAQIKKQSGYSFVYYKEDLAKGEKITLHLSSASIDEVLQQVLKDQPLTYTIVDKTVVVKLKEQGHSGLDPEPFSQLSQPPPPIDITGKVTDADGNPLVGASIKVKGSSKGTTTNNEGVFVLKGVDGDAMLEISFIGYETLSVGVNNRNAIVTALKLKPQDMNEVVINKGYYTEKQRNSVGNVTKITSKDIERQPVDNPLLALKGLVPGLLITQANGIPGGGVTVRIQGQNSIAAGSDPLYVIDGVPYPSEMLTTTSVSPILGGASPYSYSPSGNGSPLSYINPSDIESIEVLKDADATSIYGSRAANGAILITTKSGKVGSTKVDINFQQGWGKVTRTMNVMKTQQYLEMRKEALANDNVTIRPTDANYDVNGLWDQNRYADWVKTLIGGTAKYTNINSSVSGGNSYIQYLVGATYHKETTVFPGDFNDQKGSVHFNINSLSSNKKFRLNLMASYLVDNNQLPENDYTTSAYLLSPNAPSLYNSDGTLNWAPDLSGNSSWSNPLAEKYKIYQNKTDNLISSANLSYDLFTGLNFSCRFGYNKLTTNEFSTELTPSQKPENRANYQRTANYSDGVIQVFNIEPQLNYKMTFGKGALDFLVGATIQQQGSNGENLTGGGFTTDGLSDLRSATVIIAGSTVDATYKYNAAFGRLNYNWKNKYIVNVTTRRDGSSRFGPENRFHNFGSVGGAWIFSDENYFHRNLKFLSFGKFKASYGTTGNDQIGDYTFLETYVSNNPQVAYQGAGSITSNRITNPYLQWEETRKLSAGLELGFIKDRIVINANYGRNRSSNQLISYNLPITTGFTSVTRNFPATVQNSTWEFSLTTVNLKEKAIEWSSSLNLTIPKNKLVAFPGLESTSYANYLVIGQPLSINKAYVFEGLDPTTGIYRFAAANGGFTRVPDVLQDPTRLINVDPKFYGGFQNSIRYKGFQMDVLFQFISQTQKDAYRFGMGVLPPGYSKANQPPSVLDRWQKPGDLKSIQRFGVRRSAVYSSFYSANYSDAAYVDASYIRFENLSLSYDLDNQLLRKLHIDHCRFFVHGQNLLTLSNFKGIDPENHSNATLAPLKIFTVGLQMGL